MNYSEYLQSKHWLDLRAAKLHEVNDRCQKCKRRSKLQVHHFTYERIGHELLSDLQVLCERCHENAHNLFPYIKDDWHPTAKKVHPVAEHKKQLAAIIHDPNQQITLTAKLIKEASFYCHNGFTSAHAAVFGLKMNRGWLKSLIGKTTTVAKYQEFVKASRKLK